MDLYSVFTTGHLFLDHGAAKDSRVPAHTPTRTAAGGYDWHKWTTAPYHLTGGAQPLPILTAIRHE
jgi:phospholipase A2